MKSADPTSPVAGPMSLLTKLAALPTTSGKPRVREIEVEYRMDELEALRVALKAQDIELSEPVCQDDQAYDPATWQFEYWNPRRAASACRIGESDMETTCFE